MPMWPAGTDKPKTTLGIFSLCIKSFIYISYENWEMTAPWPVPCKILNKTDFR